MIKKNEFLRLSIYLGILLLSCPSKAVNLGTGFCFVSAYPSAMQASSLLPCIDYNLNNQAAFLKRKRVVVNQIPLSDLKDYRELSVDETMASPMMGASHWLSQVAERSYFSQEQADANIMLYHSLFHSADQINVVATKLARHAAYHLEAQSFAHFVHIGLLAEDLSLSAFLERRDELEDRLFQLVMSEEHSEAFGPSFSSSIEGSKSDYQDLVEQRNAIKKQKKKGKSLLKLAEKSGDEQQIKLAEIDLEQIQSKLDLIVARTAKAKIQDDEVAHSLRDLIVNYLDAFKETKQEGAKYSSCRPITTILSYFWTKTEQGVELAHYVNKLNSLRGQPARGNPTDLLKTSPQLSLEQLDGEDFTAKDLKERLNLWTWYFEQKGINHKAPMARYAHVKVDDQSFSDCVETSIRNFMNAVFWSPLKNRIDIHLLLELAAVTNVHEDLIAFYKKYQTTDDLKTLSAAKNDFAKLMSHLNKLVDSEDNVEYVIEQSKELRSGKKNILKVLELLFGCPFETLVDHLNRLGVSISLDMEQEDWNPIDIWIRENKFSWSIRPRHAIFDIKETLKDTSEEQVKVGKKIVELCSSVDLDEHWPLLNHYIQLNNNPKIISSLASLPAVKNCPAKNQDLLLHQSISSDNCSVPLRLELLINLEMTNQGQYMDEIKKTVEASFLQHGDVIDQVFNRIYKHKSHFKDVLNLFREHGVSTLNILTTMVRDHDFSILNFDFDPNDNGSFYDFDQYLFSLGEKDYLALIRTLASDREGYYKIFLAYLLMRPNRELGVKTVREMIAIDPEQNYSVYASYPHLISSHDYLKLAKLNLLGNIEGIQKEIKDKLEANIYVETWCKELFEYIFESGPESMYSIANLILPYLEYRSLGKYVGNVDHSYFKFLKNYFNDLFSKDKLDEQEIKSLSSFVSAFLVKNDKTLDRHFIRWHDAFIKYKDNILCYIFFRSIANSPRGIEEIAELFDRGISSKLRFLANKALISGYRDEICSDIFEDLLDYELSLMNKEQLVEVVGNLSDSCAKTTSKLVKKHRKRLPWFSTWFKL